MVEDAFEIAADEHGVGEFTDGAEGELIAHHVDHAGSARLGGEGVDVMPEAVGAAHLHVGEAVWRIPGEDFGLPGDGEAMPFEPVIEACAGTHFDGLWGEDPKSEPCRGDGFQITGVGEEGEDFFEGGRNELFAAQRVDGHSLRLEDFGVARLAERTETDQSKGQDRPYL